MTLRALAEPVFLSHGVAPTVAHVLEQHAARFPERAAYTALENGEVEGERRSFGELDARARAIARWLAGHGLVRRRVLLLVADSIGFIDAFAGCFYAGTVPIPAAVPRRNRPVTTIRAILRDAQVAAVITTRALQEYLQPVLDADGTGVEWRCLDDVPDDTSWSLPDLTPEAPAFIQYTSGSTTEPKGVTVTHANLTHNERAIQRAMRLTPDSLIVTWLPLYHDMGLIGNVLQPLYTGFHCVLMPPVAFLQKPVRWLRAMSQYRGTVSGAPNFAYDFCVDRIQREDCVRLDLSAWDVAYVGSEPISARTLRRFAAAFAEAGFRERSFFPCYGLAEHTLFVSGGPQQGGPEIVELDADAQGICDSVRAASVDMARVAPRVMCGEIGDGITVQIVDPATGGVLPGDTIGEVWVAGGSVARGYYNRDEESARAFAARTSPPDGAAWLRTGDLGFMRGRRLCVTGRLKDVIIIRGRNFYPQDLEDAVQRSSPSLAKGRGAAIAHDEEGQEGIAIVQELARDAWRRGVDTAALCSDVRECLTAEFGVRVSRILIVKPNSVPRTSSGKVRRTLCRRMLESGLFADSEPAGEEGLP